jgi:lysophospholipase L1-like esterase
VNGTVLMHTNERRTPMYRYKYVIHGNKQEPVQWLFRAIILGMRRIMLFLALLIICIGSGAWYLTQTTQQVTQPQAYAPLGQGDVYVALGDSLAAGFIVNQPADAYVAQIATALRGVAPVEVRNFAVPGETSASFLRRQVPSAVKYIQEQRDAGKRVSPITLDIGGNDARAAERGTIEQRQQTIAAIEANIGTALDQLLAATKDNNGQRTADIAIMTYYNPFPGDPTDQRSPAYWSNKLNEAITRSASTRGVAVADVAGAFEGGKVYRYTYIASGDIHANSDGHRLIAERFLAALGYGSTN